MDFSGTYEETEHELEGLADGLDKFKLKTLRSLCK